MGATLEEPFPEHSGATAINVIDTSIDGRTPPVATDFVQRFTRTSWWTGRQWRSCLTHRAPVVPQFLVRWAAWPGLVQAHTKTIS